MFKKEKEKVMNLLLYYINKKSRSKNGSTNIK